MKRTFERILLMVIGSVIALFAYMFGNIDKGADAEEFIDPNFGEVIGCDTLIVNGTLLVGNPESGHAVIKANGDEISIVARNRKGANNFISISVSNSETSLELAEFTTGNRLLMNADKRSAIYAALQTKDYEAVRRLVSMGFYQGRTGIKIEDNNGEKNISTTN